MTERVEERLLFDVNDKEDTLAASFWQQGEEADDDGFFAVGGGIIADDVVRAFSGTIHDEEDRLSPHSI